MGMPSRPRPACASVVPNVNCRRHQKIGPCLGGPYGELDALNAGRRERSFDAGVFGLTSNEVELFPPFDEDPSLPLRRLRLAFVESANFDQSLRLWCEPSK